MDPLRYVKRVQRVGDSPVWVIVIAAERIDVRDREHREHRVGMHVPLGGVRTVVVLRRRVGARCVVAKCQLGCDPRDDLGDTKVRESRSPVGVDEDVLRLDVSVRDMLAVCVNKPRQDPLATTCVEVVPAFRRTLAQK